MLYRPLQGKTGRDVHPSPGNAAAQPLSLVRGGVGYRHTHQLGGWLVNGLDTPRLDYCGRQSLGEAGGCDLAQFPFIGPRMAPLSAVVLAGESSRWPPLPENCPLLKACCFAERLHVSCPPWGSINQCLFTCKQVGRPS